MDHVNLIPDHRQVRRRRRSRIRLWLWIVSGYLVATVMGLMSLYVCWKEGDRDVDHGLETITRRVEYFDTTIKRLRQERVKVSSVHTTSQAIRSQPDWSKLLILISDSMDNDILLNGCQMVTLDGKDPDDSNIKQVSSTVPSAPDLLGAPRRRLTLTGYGLQQSAVSQFVVRLEQSGLFSSVSMTQSRRQAFLNQKVIAFNIQCRL